MVVGCRTGLGCNVLLLFLEMGLEHAGEVQCVREWSVVVVGGYGRGSAGGRRRAVRTREGKGVGGPREWVNFGGSIAGWWKSGGNGNGDEMDRGLITRVPRDRD